MRWYETFSVVLNMSLTAGIVILFLLPVRLCLKRAPKLYSYLLWAVVLFRLLCPVSIPSPVSLLGALEAPVTAGSGGTNTVAYIPAGAGHGLPVAAQPETGEVFGERIAEAGDTFGKTQRNTGNIAGMTQPGEAVLRLGMGLAFLWAAGVLAMAGRGFVSCWKLRKKLVGALPLQLSLPAKPAASATVFLADRISAPFVMGLLRPRIYLPSALAESERAWEREYVILHERHHIRRLDHVWKTLAYAALCIHWFNPLVWIAFFMSAKDMEMSCDEAVVGRLGVRVRAEYSLSLLQFAAGSRLLPGMPLAFGEGDTRDRIENLAKWKKPALWITIVAAAGCVAVILISGLNPREAAGKEAGGGSAGPAENMAEEAEKKDGQDPLEAALSQAILEYNRDAYAQEYFSCESHMILDTETTVRTHPVGDDISREYVTVYAMVLFQAYDISDSGITDMGGGHMPAAITFEVQGEEYVWKEYWTPMDGSYYVSSIREKFPDHIEEEAIDTQKYILAQIQNCYDQAVRHGNLNTDRIVETLLETIASSPGTELESGIASYIQNESIAWRELTYYGSHTLRACFGQFLEGNRTDLKGLLMAQVCREIIAGFGETQTVETVSADGQEWFDAFYANAKALEKELSQEELQERYPGSWIVLNMAAVFRERAGEDLLYRDYGTDVITVEQSCRLYIDSIGGLISAENFEGIYLYNCRTRESLRISSAMEDVEYRIETPGVYQVYAVSEKGASFNINGYIRIEVDITPGGVILL